MLNMKTGISKLINYYWHTQYLYMLFEVDINPNKDEETAMNETVYRSMEKVVDRIKD